MSKVGKMGLRPEVVPGPIAVWPVGQCLGRQQSQQQAPSKLGIFRKDIDVAAVTGLEAGWEPYAWGTWLEVVRRTGWPVL